MADELDIGQQKPPRVLHKAVEAGRRLAFLHRRVGGRSDGWAKAKEKKAKILRQKRRRREEGRWRNQGRQGEEGSCRFGDGAVVVAGAAATPPPPQLRYLGGAIVDDKVLCRLELAGVP